MSLEFPLRGERVLVRPFEENDVAAAHRIYGDAEVMRYVGSGRPASSLMETACMIEDYRSHQLEHGFAFWAVLEVGTGELMGDAGLAVTVHGIEIGYTLGRPWWGQGLATEAAGLCMQAAFGPLGLRRLVALADANNPASARVLTKLGFRGDGKLRVFGRSHLRFALEPDGH